MKTLILIRGLQGSGKTTLAKMIIHNRASNPSLNDHVPSGFDVSADEFFCLNTGEYDFDSTKLNEAHKWCQKQCRDAMNIKCEMSELIVVHNTFAQQWEVDPYLAMAKEYAYTVQMIECQGHFDNIHHVPKETIDRTRNRWETLTISQ